MSGDNSPAKTGPFGKIPVSRLFHIRSIDFARKLEETKMGSISILLAVEHLSSWPVAAGIVVQDFNGAGSIKVVEERICAVYGKPVRILSDGDSNFDNAAVRKFPSHERITCKIISPYNPRETRSRNGWSALSNGLFRNMP